jgi:class 3 adenylate cyclase
MRMHRAPRSGNGSSVARRRPPQDGRQVAGALRRLPMFADCNPADLALIDTLTAETQVPAGRVLLREGHQANQMLIVVAGRARISRNGETLGTAGPGACVSGRELRAHAANTVTMTAETPMVLRAASARELASLLFSVPLLEFVSPPAVRLPVIDLSGPNGGHHGTSSAGPTGGVADEIEEFLRRDSTAASSRVLAAVMFTDIVRSTSLVSTMGDGAWHSLLDAHDSIVGHEVVRHGGAVVNFLGDGALARFECANSAARCALAVRDAVRDLGIDVRAGLHAGEVEQRGTDITGIVVHVASRICDLAGTGRVLASRTLMDLVAGSGLVFKDAGTHALKDVGGEWRLLEVAAMR